MAEEAETDPIADQGTAAKEAGFPASDCPYGEEGSGDLADRWHAAYAAAKVKKAK